MFVIIIFFTVNPSGFPPGVHNGKCLGKIIRFPRLPLETRPGRKLGADYQAER